MEQIPMDSILSEDKPTPPATTEAPVETSPEADAEAKAAADEQRREEYKSKRTKARDKEAIAQGKVRDPDTGQFVAPDKVAALTPAATEAPKVEAKPAVTAPAQEFTEKEKAFLRAAQEERAKRQALEQRLAAMEAAKPKEAEKAFWDDPEGAIAKQKREFEQQILSMRLGTSEQIARSRYADFDEKVAKFTELANTTPGLAQQMFAHPDPATFVYQTAKNHIELQQAGGIEEMRAKIERETAARVRAEVEAELNAKVAALAKAKADLPPSLSSARAVGDATKPVWGGPPSMKSILED